MLSFLLQNHDAVRWSRTFWIKFRRQNKPSSSVFSRFLHVCSFKRPQQIFSPYFRKSRTPSRLHNKQRCCIGGVNSTKPSQGSTQRCYIQYFHYSEPSDRSIQSQKHKPLKASYPPSTTPALRQQLCQKLSEAFFVLFLKPRLQW